MRSYSLFSIVLLCAAIVLIDILAYYWLQSITRLITSAFLRVTIHVLFWVFTLGLVSSILILKMKLDQMDPQRKHVLVSSLYGLTVSSFVPKILFVIVISILFFTNFMFSETESMVIIPIIGLLSGFLPFFFHRLRYF